MIPQKYLVVDGCVNDIPKEGCKTCSTGESYIDYYFLCNSKVPLGSRSSLKVFESTIPRKFSLILSFSINFKIQKQSSGGVL